MQIIKASDNTSARAVLLAMSTTTVEARDRTHRHPRERGDEHAAAGHPELDDMYDGSEGSQTNSTRIELLLRGRAERAAEGTRVQAAIAPHRFCVSCADPSRYPPNPSSKKNRVESAPISAPGYGFLR